MKGVYNQLISENVLIATGEESHDGRSAELPRNSTAELGGMRPQTTQLLLGSQFLRANFNENCCSRNVRDG